MVGPGLFEGFAIHRHLNAPPDLQICRADRWRRPVLGVERMLELISMTRPRAKTGKKWWKTKASDAMAVKRRNGTRDSLETETREI